MRWQELHPWDVTPQQAIDIQRRLATQVVRLNGITSNPRYIAGVDISPEDSEGMAIGAVVVLSYPELKLVEVKTARSRPIFPYIPGLLSFRESSLILAALEKLSQTPDLLLVDGQGIAHPRRLGIACHLGLLIDLPAIGCAKSILRGKHSALGREAGSWTELIDRGEVVGAAVRTRVDINPIYVSIGHKVDLQSAVYWTLASCKGYRLPEPTRTGTPGRRWSVKGVRVNGAKDSGSAGEAILDKNDHNQPELGAFNTIRAFWQG